MTSNEHFPRNVPFKPSAAFIPWFIIDFLLLLVVCVAGIVLPFIFSTGTDMAIVTLAVLTGMVVITIVFVVWTRLYFESMSYELHDDEMRWKRGVWFRTTGIVPYNRITNLDLRQGPVMRYLKISSIAVQTAGYSGQAVPEIRIEAIEHAEELRELLRNAVRTCSGTGDATGTGTPAAARPADMPFATTGTSMLILDELRKIRMLLEQQKK
jgi:membrane protein YdbS with pleckstrin-like domain